MDMQRGYFPLANHHLDRCGESGYRLPRSPESYRVNDARSGYRQLQVLFLADAELDQLDAGISKPFPRLARRCQHSQPEGTFRIDLLLLAHGQSNREMREHAIPKADNEIRFAGHRGMYCIPGQQVAQ